MLIDAHCHLEHLGEVGVVRFLSSLTEKGLRGVIASGPRRKDWPFYTQLASQFPQLKVCYGIHPLEITEQWEDDLACLESYLDQAVALGEIGLDFNRIFDIKHAQNLKLQMKVFERQLALAKRKNLPVVIHCRDAFTILKEILIYSKIDLSRVMFHCFVEDETAAEWILSQGGYLSYSGILTFKKPGFTLKTAQLAPLDRIFVETDTPYLAPVPYRGKTNSPEYVRYVVEKLAEIKNVSYEQCYEQLKMNVQKFFGCFKNSVVDNK